MITIGYRSNFESIHSRLERELLAAGQEVDVGEVHAMDVGESPEWKSVELQNVVIEWIIPERIRILQEMVKPNLPWAEHHFLERVSGKPLNPPPSAEYWPYTVAGHSAHVDEGGKFSHTYPERFWCRGHKGIRYEYGDLVDVVNLLTSKPLTRQAYLPVWFPEDTGGGRVGQRVPCTLGYHFLIRNGLVDITYFIRSCDFMRYFRDDVYMACRLAMWVADHLNESTVFKTRLGSMTNVGTFTMHISSLHMFTGDRQILRRRNERSKATPSSTVSRDSGTDSEEGNVSTSTSGGSDRA